MKPSVRRNVRSPSDRLLPGPRRAPGRPRACSSAVLAWASALPACAPPRPLGAARRPAAFEPAFSTAASRNTTTARAMSPISSPRSVRHPNVDVVPPRASSPIASVTRCDRPRDRPRDQEREAHTAIMASRSRLQCRLVSRARCPIAASAFAMRDFDEVRMRDDRRLDCAIDSDVAVCSFADAAQRSSTQDALIGGEVPLDAFFDAGGDVRRLERAVEFRRRAASCPRRAWHRDERMKSLARAAHRQIVTSSRSSLAGRACVLDRMDGSCAALPRGRNSRSGSRPSLVSATSAKSRRVAAVPSPDALDLRCASRRDPR